MPAAMPPARPALVHNHAATIEALGSLTLGADTLRNTNGGVTYTMVDGPAQRVLEFALNGTPTRFAADEALLVAWRPDVGAGGQDPLIWPSFSAVPASSFGSGDTAAHLLCWCRSSPATRWRATATTTSMRRATAPTAAA